MSTSPLCAYRFMTGIGVLFFVGVLSVFAQAPEAPVEEPVEEQVEEQVTEVIPYVIEGIPGGGEVIGDFVVGPGKVDLTMQPGESRVVEINITNRTGEPRIFNINAEDATGSRDIETAIVLLGDDRGPYSMKDYVSVASSSFPIDHNMRARVPVTITIPEDAEPGGLYGSVLIDTIAIHGEVNEVEGAAPRSAVVARIGTLFFITIPGTVEKEGGLKDFSTVPEKMFYQGGPINFGILYENTGSIHLAPYGELRITNLFGEEVGYASIEPWFILPQSVRLREISWDREFLFGKYTATVYVNRSYDDVIDEMSYTFYVFPWKIILGVFVVLFVFFFLIRVFLRNFEFKRKEQ